MANKKVSQLVSKPSVLVTDLFPIADPTTGQLYKTTISDLGTAIGSGVSSVNTLVGAVVLDTDDIQELVSPTNKWFTDTRARAALSASSPLAYNSGTGVFSIPAATSSQNGYLTSTDWTTFNAKQQALSGTGFVKISGTTISYDNSTYLTTSAAASTYLALAGGTLTGALNGTSANFSGDLTLTGTNPRFYLTDSDNNPDYFISNTDGTFTVYDVTNSTSRFTIGTTGNGTFGGNLTVGQIIRSGGTSSQFLKADGSVDSTAYVSGSGATGYYARFTGSRVISDGFIQTTSNITYVEGMGLSTLNGLDITGNYGAGGGGLKIRSYDETTGKAYMEFFNTSGNFRLGLEGSTGGGILPGSTAYATVLTTGLTAKNLEFGTNNVKRLTIDGTTGAATFSSSVTASALYVSGMTAGSGAIYHTGSRLTFANYNASGTLHFEVNGGTGALTINSDTSASFVSTISATGATLTGALSGTSATFSGTLGIGTSSPAYKLDVTGIGRFRDATGYEGAFIEGANGIVYLGSLGSDAISLYSGGVDRMRITSGGNVGIGTTSPTDYSGYTTLHVNGKSGTGSGVIRVTNFNGTAGFNMYADNAATFNTTSAIPILFLTQDTERMRITSGGALLVGTTSTFSPGFTALASGYIGTTITSGTNIQIWNQATSGNNEFVTFYTEGGGGALRGSITYNRGAGLVSYNVSSDYRLKTDFKEFNGSDVLNKVKVYDYELKETGARVYGVIAHELAEVLPYAVTGEKDGEKMQGVDYSKIVPVMVQAIKDLKAELDTLKNK